MISTTPTLRIHTLLLAILLLSHTTSLASSDLHDITAQDIIKKVEDNLNGETAQMHITMTIKTSRSTRAMEMNSYSVGSKKSFIKITYPKKDRGITFLKVNNGMWQYVPRIEKIIKIPSSMMLQSWMGSDFTNDDLVRESSISEDYSASLLSEEQDNIKLLLTPREDAPVVWGKIIMDVSQTFFLPVKVLYYDEDDILVRELVYENIKKFNDNYYPTHWQMTPKTKGKSGNSTTVDIRDAVFDEPIDESYFSKRALKIYSR